MANVTTSFYSLDTVFTPNSGCLAPTFSIPPLGNDAFARGVPDQNVSTLIRGIASGCYPDGFANQTTTTTQDGLPTEVLATNIIYTPGVCPSGYTSATGSAGSSYSYATCCPSNLTLSAVTTGSDTPCVAWVQTNGDATVLYVSEILTLTSSISYIASPVTVAYRVNERGERITTSGTGTAAPTSSQTEETTFGSKSGLSRDAKIGIGVGVGIGVVAIALLVAVLWWVRRRYKRNQGETTHDKTEDASYVGGGKAELPGDGKKPQLDELDHHENAMHEADGLGRPPEADAANVRAELEGDWHGWEAPPQHRTDHDA